MLSALARWQRRSLLRKTRGGFGPRLHGEHMIYWMKSADGGRMPVYDKSESEKLIGFGWTLINFGPEPTMQGDIHEPQTVTADPVLGKDWSVAEPVSTVTIERKKPGRPRKAE